jgi:superfamily II DNA or RNA helicase
MKSSSVGQGWQYSTVHNSACKAIEEQTLWGRTVCRVWLPNQDAVVRVPRSALRPLSADLQPEIEVERVAEYNRSRFEDLITAGWDLVVVDEAHRLGGSTDQVARHKLGKGLAEAAPYVLLLSATPHQGKTDAFHRLMNLLDDDAFPDMDSVSRERVAPYVIRTEKRKAIDADGTPLFKPRRTQMAPVAWESRHHLQQLLYKAVTDYVREGYNQALREKKRHIGFLMILMQRLVVSSTRAIRTTLERRLAALKEDEQQASPRLKELERAELENGAERSESPDDEMAQLYDMDGQELLDELLKSHASALQSEGSHVETLLDAAVRCEHAGPDAKAEALLEWIYELQAEENEPDLKVLIFTEFVPTQQMLKEFLEARGISVVTLNGSMDMEERKQAQDAFRKSHRVLVSTDAGGEGLNLQFAHVIINYDIPWNPMRLEQRIGRVDRIGQPKTVRAINFVFEDSVEFRVREVLEQKLSVIFDEFGIDKTGDVLDSAQAGELFEDVFAQALVNPDGIETSVDHTVARLRDAIHEVRETSAIYGISEEPDVQAAERLRSHPLPHWVERMTVGYLNSHGGAASRKRSWWDLVWPDGQEHRRAVFSAREADRLTDATLLNLENSRVRGLALNLPQIAAGQPLPCVSVSGLPASISGLWGLFEIRLQAGMHQKTQLLRIPRVRRGYVSVFLSEEGKLFLPTARHIWDALQTAEAQVQTTLGQDESIIAHERLQIAAERAGQELFDTLQQAHLASVAREEERGVVSFASRRKAIERVGLPEVRQFRLSRCDADEAEWRHKLQSARQIVPEIRPLLMLKIMTRR